VVYVRMTYDMGSSVSEEFILFESSRGALKMEVVSFFRKIFIPDYFLTVWKEAIQLHFGLKWGHEI